MKSNNKLIPVTIATRVFEPEATAAAYRLGHLQRELEQRGHSVTVLTTRSPNATRSTPAVRRWPVLRDQSGSVRGYVQYATFDIPLFFRLVFGPRASSWIIEPPPTTGVVARAASWIRRTPYIYYSADVTSSAVKAIGVNRLVVRVVTAMEQWVLRGATKILAVSEGVSLELQALGTASAKISMVGTGIDTDRFNPNGEVESPGFRYFVYAGTMSEFQGAQVFVDSFRRIASAHPQVKLIMFGGGVDVERLKRRASEVADQVEFPGLVSAEVVARWMRGAVAGLASVRPGQGYDFAVPTKTLASVACGTGVIFAGVGPMRELIKNRDLGWAVDWDADDVAAAMESALAPPKRRLNGDQIAWLVQNYSLKAVAGRGAEVITDVVAQRRK